MQMLFDAATNSLRFVLADSPRTGASTMLPATLDIGERGRLLALTVTLPGGRDVDIVLDDDDGGASRSASAQVVAHFDDTRALLAVDLPRRGAGYEITYPSGNQ